MSPEPAHDRLAAAHDLLVGQVAKLTSSTEWRAMLEAARWFHSYSPRNVLLLLAQGAHGRVAGYRAWQNISAHGGGSCQVARGATGHLILAPVHRVVREPDADGEERIQRWLRGFKAVRVFDETQLVAPPAVPEVRPQVLTGVAPGRLATGLTAVVRAQGYSLVERDVAPAFGRTDFASREVAIRSGLAPAAHAKTLAHETAHVLLHSPDAKTPVARSREQKEVEAESVAYLIAAHANLDTSAYSFPYIARWANGDLDLIRQTAERAITAARELTRALEPHLAPDLDQHQRTADVVTLPVGPSTPGPGAVTPEFLQRLDADTAAALRNLESNPAAWAATPSDLDAVRRAVEPPQPAIERPASVGIELD